MQQMLLLAVSIMHSNIWALCWRLQVDVSVVLKKKKGRPAHLG